MAWQRGERGVGVAVWLQLSPETSTENGVTAEVEGGGGGGGGGRRREEAKAINPGFSPGLPLLLHVGRGGKLIMWLRLIR